MTGDEGEEVDLVAPKGEVDLTVQEDDQEAPKEDPEVSHTVLREEVGLEVQDIAEEIGKHYFKSLLYCTSILLRILMLFSRRRRHSYSRSRSPPRRRHRSPSKSRSKSPVKKKSPSPVQRPFGFPPSPDKFQEPESEESALERDQRTVFCMQLARNIRPRDLEEFFSKVGQVKKHLLSFDCFCSKSQSISLINILLLTFVRCQMYVSYLIETPEDRRELLTLNLQTNQLYHW